MKRSVVVVSYKPTQWLDRSLASVADQADELVVVDNGSSGGEAGEVGRRFGAKVVRLERNVGVAPGMNAGMDAATGDVIALLNDDAVAEPGWLDSAVKAMEPTDVAAVAPKLLLALPYAEVRLDQTPSTAPGDPRPLGRQLRAATVGPIDVLPGLTGRGVHRLERDGAVRWRWTAGFGPIFVPLPEGYEPTDIRVDGQPVDAVRIVDLVNNAGSYLSSDGSGGDVGYEAPDGGDFDEPADRFAACGAAMVMPAHVIRAVGPMASNFFAYYEDTDWCWRAQLAGFRIRYEPAGLVRHVRWATSGGPSSEFASLLAARNRILTLVRNAPRERYHEEVAKALGSDEPPGIRRSLTRRLPVARLERARLGRRWVRSPVDVWERWAGVNDRWSEG